MIDPQGKYAVEAVVIVGVAAGAYSAYTIYNSWKEFWERAEAYDKKQKEFLEHPSDEGYAEKEKKFHQAYTAGVKAGVSTPGTSSYGPPPTSWADLITSTVTDIFNKGISSLDARKEKKTQTGCKKR